MSHLLVKLTGKKQDLPEGYGRNKQHHKYGNYKMASYDCKKIIDIIKMV